MERAATDLSTLGTENITDNNKYQGVKNFTLVARMQKIVALS